MTVLFDSSTLIAAIVESHNKHEPAFLWLSRAKQKEFSLVVAAHSLLEVYSVLTAAPFTPRISPKTANHLIDLNIKSIATIQSFDAKDYGRLLKTLERLEIKGGSVYDALIYACTKKAKAEKLITLNAKDFNRFNMDHSIDIVTL